MFASARLALDALDQVPWATLEHAYGPATDIPALIRRAAAPDPEVHRRACAELLHRLDHQGLGRGWATAHAMPYLIALLGDPTVRARARIAELLAELTVGDTCWFLHHGFHPDRAPQDEPITWGRGLIERPAVELDLRAGGPLRAIYDAAADGLAAYRRALTVADQPLRQALPYLLAWLTTRADETVPILVRMLHDDASPAVRASAALGLSLATAFDRAAARDARTELLAAWRAADTRLVRRCTALALVRTGEVAAPSVVEALLDELRGGSRPVSPSGFPWHRVDSAAFVCATLSAGVPSERRGEVATAAADALGHCVDPDDAGDLARWLVAQIPPGTDVAALPALARRILGDVAATDLVWYYPDAGDALADRGLPGRRDQLLACLSLPS